MGELSLTVLFSNSASLEREEKNALEGFLAEKIEGLAANLTTALESYGRKKDFGIKVKSVSVRVK